MFQFLAFVRYIADGCIERAFRSFVKAVSKLQNTAFIQDASGRNQDFHVEVE